MKSLSHVIQSLYFDPLLITEKGHASLRAVVESKLSDNYLAGDWKIEEGKDIFGNDLPKLEIEGNVAVVPVVGPIIKRASMIDASCGLVGTTQIRENINTALGTNGVDTIVFYINSPGGTVTGVPELVEYIKEISSKVKTIAYIDELGASAAWWLASACSEIYAAPTADILSVGVYSYFLDVTKAYEQMGIQTKLFKDGDLKAIGVPGVPLTEKQIAYLQNEVTKLGNVFRGFVKAQRPNIPDEMLQGQTVMAYEVEAVGGIDGLADSLSDIFVN